MYYYVIRYVLLNQVKKTGIVDDIGGFTLDALVYLPSYNGSPKVNTAENAPPERNSPSMIYFFIIL